MSIRQEIIIDAQLLCIKVGAQSIEISSHMLLDKMQEWLKIEFDADVRLRYGLEVSGAAV